MKEDGLGRLFLRQLVMAIPWGIIFLLVLLIAAVGIKQQIKESIQYTARTCLYETAALAFDYRIVTTVKRNVKEGIEFLAKTARNEARFRTVCSPPNGGSPARPIRRTPLKGARSRRPRRNPWPPGAYPPPASPMV